MSDSFEFDAPEHFTVGAVGQPGERVFYLQARQGQRVVSLRSEKEQVRLLADYVGGFLVHRPTKATGQAPELLQPVDTTWAVAALGVGYDAATDRIVIEATEVVEDEQQEAATATFRITRSQAAGFVERARAVVKAGRPTCPMCGGPQGPEPHVCPRSNGHAGH